MELKPSKEFSINMDVNEAIEINNTIHEWKRDVSGNVFEIEPNSAMERFLDNLKRGIDLTNS